MKGFLIVASAIAGLALLPSPTYASKAKTHMMDYQLGEPSAVMPEDFTDAQFKAESKAAEERGKRHLAQVDNLDENTILSEDLRNLRNELIGGPKYGKAGSGSFPGVKTPEDLDKFLTKIDSDSYYNGLAPDAKLAAAQLSTLRVWRSFFNRTMRLVGTANVSHAAIVTMLRNLATGINVYFPTDQWKAGLKYLAMPVEGAEPSYINCHHSKQTIFSEAISLAKQDYLPRYCSNIVTDADFHDFLSMELIPVMERAAERIKNLNFARNRVWWDNKIAYGTANFADDHDRFLVVGEAERRALLSGYYTGLSGLYSLVIYNLDGFFKAWDQVGRLYGVGAIFKPEIATAQRRTNIIRVLNVKYGFLKRYDGYKPWSDKAYAYLKAAVHEADLSWKELKNSSLDQVYDHAIMDPRVFNPYARAINLSLNNMKSLISDSQHRGVSSAVIAGEPIDVNIRKLYDDPPANLCDLLPEGYNESPYKQYISFHGMPRHEVHNYENGMPVSWNVGKYHEYFPNVNDSEGVRRAARVLSQTWGGWIVGLPMAALVF